MGREQAVRRSRIRVATVSQAGQTLIELMVATSAASVLMVGLSSALFISAQAFQGQQGAQTRSRASEVQADMLKDLRQATGFTTKTATSVTFTVPDRDGDTFDETITYDWDSGNAELNYTYNGSPSQTLLTDVSSFDLSYLTRSLIGSTPTPPALAPNTWGNRWVTPYSIFGYDTQFVENLKRKNAQLATRATLAESGTVESISFYLEGIPAAGTGITAAIYDVGGKGYPNNLIVAAGSETVNSAGWHTMSLTPTALPAGDYFLALSYEAKNARYFFDSASGSIEIIDSNPLNSGWMKTWGTSNTSTTGTISIYAEYIPD